MAVLVIFNRRLEHATPWSVLLSWLESGQQPLLKHCLIYDNSPVAMVDTGCLGNKVTVISDRNNGGTASAYHAAAVRADEVGCDWLLLLDQDTVLPSDYLKRAEEAIINTPGVDVVVPRVTHDGKCISPATITPAGSVVPCLDPTRAVGIPTAISSGAIIRRTAIANMAFPPAIWLDYVDHWVFLQLAKRSSKIGVIDSQLAHDLSVRAPKTLSKVRVKSILSAERAFYHEFGGKARLLLPFRHFLRAVRYAVLGRVSLVAIVLNHICSGMVSARHD